MSGGWRRLSQWLHRSAVQRSPSLPQVQVEAGQTVAKGDPLLVLEAMKMEFRLQAPVAGTVEAVMAGVGGQVSLRQLLVQITPAA